MSIADDKITVAIVEGQKLFRDLLTVKLNEVGMDAMSFESIEQATLELKKVSSYLLLLSINYPYALNIEDIIKLKKISKDNKLVLLFEYLNQDFINMCIGASVNGILSKSFSMETFISALKVVYYGQDFIPREYQPNLEPNVKDKDLDFSHEELRIIEELGLGLTNELIAQSLDLSLPTVKLRMRNISRKLNAKNRTQVVLFAQKLGLLRGPL